MEHFCDVEPRFLIANFVSAGLNIVYSIAIGICEDFPWNCWFIVFQLCSALISIYMLKTSFRQSRRAGDILGLFAIAHLAHVLTSLLLISSVYTADIHTLQTAAVPVISLLTGAALAFLCYWHKHLANSFVQKREETANCDDFFQISPSRRVRAFCYCIGPIAGLIYAFGVSRFGSGNVPAPHSMQAVFGIITSALILALYDSRYRQSAWCSLVSAVWSLLCIALFISACVLYGMETSGAEDSATKKENHMQYGLSMIATFLYLAGFVGSFSCKFCLLREALSFNFSRPPVTPPAAGTPVAAREVGNLYVDIESQPFGMTRSEAEAAARKLGYGEQDFVQRTEDGVATTKSSSRVTESSESPSKMTL